MYFTAVQSYRQVRKILYYGACIRAISSVGRARCLHHRGREFKSLIAHKVKYSQLLAGSILLLSQRLEEVAYYFDGGKIVTTCTETVGFKSLIAHKSQNPQALLEGFVIFGICAPSRNRTYIKSLEVSCSIH